jgi:hypothetical protein
MSTERFGGRCERHLSIRPCQQCADEKPPQADAVPYGIIDPDYARIFTIARCLAWQEGYALAMHGSFTRDLDLIAVPWTGAACEADHLMRRIEDATGLKEVRNGAFSLKPHGRKAWTLIFQGFSDPRFVDLSVMPREPKATPTPPAGRSEG